MARIVEHLTEGARASSGPRKKSVTVYYREKTPNLSVSASDAAIMAQLALLPHATSMAWNPSKHRDGALGSFPHEAMIFVTLSAERNTYAPDSGYSFYH